MSQKSKFGTGFSKKIKWIFKELGLCWFCCNICTYIYRRCFINQVPFQSKSIKIYDYSILIIYVFLSFFQSLLWPFHKNFRQILPDECFFLFYWPQHESSTIRFSLYFSISIYLFICMWMFVAFCPTYWQTINTCPQWWWYIQLFKNKLFN